MCRLKALAPPRVSAAVLRTLYNGWCTHSRFQKRQAHSNICVLGCGGNAEDSIMHYCRCRVTRSIYRKIVRLHVPEANMLAQFMLHCSRSDVEVLGTALCIYGIYKCVCINGQAAGTADHTTSYDRARHCIIQAGRGHRGVQKFLDSRWSNASRGSALAS